MMLKIVVVLLLINFTTGNYWSPDPIGPMDFPAPTSNYGPHCTHGCPDCTPICPEGMTCHTTNRCSCPTVFEIYANGKCRGIPGAKCDTANPFSCIEDAQCNKQNQCECTGDKVPDGSSARCANKPGQTCKFPADCAQNLPTHCNMETNKCTCQPEYYGIPGDCFIGHNDSCQNDGQCQGSPWMNLFCIKGKCACANGQQFNKDYEPPGTSSLVKGRCEFDFGFRCMVNDQYFGMCGNGAICSSETGLCACGPLSHRVNGKCSCVPGAYIDMPDSPCVCYQDSIMYPNRCECPKNTYPNEYRHRCDWCPPDSILDPVKNSCTCFPPRHFNIQTNMCV